MNEKVSPLTEALNPVKVSANCWQCACCSAACPVTGVDGLNVRKVVKYLEMGLFDEVVASRFPWVCTLCGRCEQACPQGVELLSILRLARTQRERKRVPGPIHKGVVMALEKGNNLGIPKEDFLFLLADLSREMEEEGFPGFHVPVDKKGANILVTINSKEPFGEPDDMKFWWRIFYCAKENWTVPSKNWEGVNWALFSGDDEAMKALVGRIVEHLEQLDCKALLLPE
jgi:Fe-S oxidoreductase